MLKRRRLCGAVATSIEASQVAMAMSRRALIGGAIYKSNVGAARLAKR